MKKITKLIFLLLFAIFAFVACDKEDDTDNNPQYDHSLILSRGSGAKLVLTNPVNGKDLYLSVPSPAVDDVKGLKAGYMCQNAVFTAKTDLRNSTNLSSI